jgi:hypothetical protein
LAYQKARGYGKPDDYVFFPEEKIAAWCSTSSVGCSIGYWRT